MKNDMAQAEIEREANSAAEPLLPVEKKLIGWSLGVGIVALVILALINQL